METRSYEGFITIAGVSGDQISMKICFSKAPKVGKTRSSLGMVLLDLAFKLPKSEENLTPSS